MSMAEVQEKARPIIQVFFKPLLGSYWSNIQLVQSKTTWLGSESKGEAECSTQSRKATKNYMGKGMERGRGEELKHFFKNINMPGDREGKSRPCSWMDQLALWV